MKKMQRTFAALILVAMTSVVATIPADAGIISSDARNSSTRLIVSQPTPQGSLPFDLTSLRFFGRLMLRLGLIG